MDPLLGAGLSAAIAAIVGVARAYAPDLPPKYVPLIVLGMAIGALGIGINSGEIAGGFTLRAILDVLNVSMGALGVGRAVTQIAGVTEGGVPRLAAAAAVVLPSAPQPVTSQVVPAGAVPPREPVIQQDPPPAPGQPPTVP